MKTALVLIDIQNDYFKGGANELVGQEAAAKNAAKILALFRRKNLPVFHVQHIATHVEATFFLPNTHGAQIYELVAPLPHEPVIVKHAPDSFLGTELNERLKTLGAERILVCGSMSHMCIDTTVRGAMEKGFKVVLAHDACATKDLSFNGENLPAALVHKAFMAAMSGIFADVKSTDEVLADFSE